MPLLQEFGVQSTLILGESGDQIYEVYEPVPLQKSMMRKDIKREKFKDHEFFGTSPILERSTKHQLSLPGRLVGGNARRASTIKGRLKRGPSDPGTLRRKALSVKSAAKRSKSLLPNQSSIHVSKEGAISEKDIEFSTSSLNTDESFQKLDVTDMKGFLQAHENFGYEMPEPILKYDKLSKLTTDVN